MDQTKRAGNGGVGRRRTVASTGASTGARRTRTEGAWDPAAGRLIAVEGVDGSGKSTQLHLLEQWLRHQNLKVFKTE